jgi:hypothetical protein
MRAEFECVAADVGAGTDHIIGMIDRFQKMPNAEHLVERYKKMIDKAIKVCVSDRESFDEDHISFTTMPDEPIFIGFSGRSHEAAAAPLIDRACRILNYRATLG